MGELLLACAGEACATSRMLCAIDGARGVIEPVVEANAVEAGKPAVVSGAHVPFLATDGGFALHEAVGLSRPESASANTLCDPLVLEGASD